MGYDDSFSRYGDGITPDMQEHLDSLSYVDYNGINCSDEYHVTANGEVIKIAEMSDKHLINCVRYFSKPGPRNISNMKYFNELRRRYPKTYRNLI